MEAERRVFKRFERLKKPDRVVSWSLAPSPRAAKKWVVTIIDQTSLIGASKRPSGLGLQVHFGDSSMEDYTQHRDKERRRRFHQRFATLIAQTRNNPLSPMYYSAKLLW